MSENEWGPTDTAPVNKDRCVVRLRTGMWSDKTGLHIKKSLTFLRKRCEGFNILEEDCDVGGIESVLPRILNLNVCQDGIYEVVTCNEIRDFETNYIEDYGYRLVPYKTTTLSEQTE